MPTITDLVVYPLKSAKGLHLDSATLSDTGFTHDREWMVVDADARYLTQREHPKLALIQPHLSDATLSLEAPGLSNVTLSTDASRPIACTLFGEECKAFQANREADAWISAYLGNPAMIVSRDRRHLRRGGLHYSERDARPTTFVDNYGLLILSRASLADLNARLEAPVPMNRFRPNIVVDGLSAYAEEEAAGFTTRDVRLAVANVCTRCALPNIDQDTAAVGKEPFQTLSSFRFDKSYPGVRFGVYAVVADGIGRSLRIGDALSVH